MSALQQLAHVIANLMREDSRRILLGEDIRDGGMLGLSRIAAQDPTLDERILGTPLTTNSLFAHAGGLASAGHLPIVICSSCEPLMEGFAALREIMRNHWRFEERRPLPMLILAPTGPGFGTGGDANDSIESLLLQVPGIQVYSVGQVEDLRGALVSAANFEVAETPTVLLLPKNLLLQELAPLTNGKLDALPQLDRDLHRVVQRRGGEQATVFCWGATVDLCLRAVELSQINAAVIDISALSPIDEEGLLRAARATGKLIIVHGGRKNTGIGGQLTSRFADGAILHLDAPVVCVGGSEGFVSSSDEAAALPDLESVVTAIQHVANY